MALSELSVSMVDVRLKLCASCLYFPREISPRDLFFIESVVSQYNPAVVKAWMKGENLSFPGAAPKGQQPRQDAKKVRFHDLNEPVWCRRERVMTQAAEICCIFWQPRVEKRVKIDTFF